MRLLAALAIVFAVAMPAAAQDAGTSRPIQPVLVIDPNRLFADSNYAAKLSREVEALAVEIQSENQSIVDELVAEERALADQRPDMSPEEFQIAADAFDLKAQQIRDERDAKEAELEGARVAVRDRFLADVRGVLGQVMSERGATVVMDSRSVYIALTAADITNEVVARVDAQFMGDTNNED